MTSRWQWCLWNPSPAEHNTITICLHQEQSVHRSMCTCAYQPFRGICVKLMKCVGYLQSTVHEKECVCEHACILIQVHVETSAWKCFIFWKRNKDKSAVCIYFVSMSERMCARVQQGFMSDRPSCGLGQWSITLWWWGAGMTTALSAPLATVW